MIAYTNTLLTNGKKDPEIRIEICFKTTGLLFYLYIILNCLSC